MRVERVEFGVAAFVKNTFDKIIFGVAKIDKISTCKILQYYDVCPPPPTSRHKTKDIQSDFCPLSRVFFRRSNQCHRLTSRTLAGKWHLVEKSWQHSTCDRQVEGRRIKDCEITPLQPGDLCRRSPVCQHRFT